MNMSVALRPRQAEQKESGRIATSKPALPMPEGLMKRMYTHFTDAGKALIVRRREERMAKGMTDGAIGASLEGEVGRSGKSIIGCIKRMVREGTLVKNPNRRNWKGFSDAEKEWLAKAAGEMAAKGKNDTQIADELARMAGRSTDSIHACMRRMVLAGKLVKNSKIGCRKYLPQEDEFIMRRREELAAKGMPDRLIVKKLAEKIKRSTGGIACRIRRKVKDGKLEKNLNGEARRLNEADKRLICRRRAELIPKGRNDHQIAHAVARRIGKNQPCIRAYIYNSVEDGELPKNPNKREMRRFGESEKAFIKRRRQQLIRGRRTDNRIAKIIAAEMGRDGVTRDWKCVLQYIKISIRKRVLRENPHKMKIRHLTESEKAFISRRREELIAGGHRDHRIAYLIGTEMKRNWKGVLKYINLRTRKGTLPENPNKMIMHRHVTQV